MISTTLKCKDVSMPKRKTIGGKYTIIKKIAETNYAQACKSVILYTRRRFRKSGQNTHKCPVIEVIMGRIRVFKAIIRPVNWTLIRYVQ